MKNLSYLFCFFSSEDRFITKMSSICFAHSA
jgi:hypothetical protein